MSELSEELLQQIIETQREQGQTLAATSVVVTSMNARLFGNGQPGVIKDLDDRIDAVEKTALTEIEKTNRKVLFAGATFTGAGTVIAFVAKFFLSKTGMGFFK